MTKSVGSEEHLPHITDQSGHHFALWTMGRSDRFNTGLTRNDYIHFIAHL